MSVISRNGYELHCLHIFQTELDRLIALVAKLEQADPFGFQHHPAAKLFDAVTDNIIYYVPDDPSHKRFRQGLTLGKEYRAWRRIKKNSLPDRYRLFFRFQSSPKTIVYAWLNDETTLRKDGAKTDVYEVFKRLLKQGKIPNSWKALEKQSDPLAINE